MFTLFLIISLLGAPANTTVKLPRVNVARVSFLKPSGINFFAYGDSKGNLITGSRFQFQRGENLRLGFGFIQHSFLMEKLKFTRTYGIFSIEYQRDILGGKIYLNFEQFFPLSSQNNFWKN